jgi:signal transduction histidine kinase
VLDDASVPTADRLTIPELVDHIPQLIDRLLDRLSFQSETGGEWTGPENEEASGVGVAHAHHRRSLDYTLTEALRELSHFRSAVLDLCLEYVVLPNGTEAYVLHSTIDEMMVSSAGAFERASVNVYEQATGVVAHELRDPLNAILIYATQLQAGEVDSQRAGKVLARNARSMDRLVQDLFVYSKLEAGRLSIHPVEVDPCNVVRELCESYQPMADRMMIDLSWAVPETAVHLRADHDRILQALGNVLGNAVKFSPRGGRVRVELDVLDDQCVFRISDTGPGVSPEHVERVFRAFWQAPGASSAGGAGLGLAIARQIIEIHGGTIAVEGHAPTGATFAISLPRSLAPAADRP